VARNGFEFENVTKLKQKDNPKFAFLFGGEYYQYYQYRLSIERQQQFSQTSNQAVVDLSIPPPIPNQVDQYISQINILQSKVNDIKEQIKQSEKNLNAQIDVSEIKKKVKIDYFSVILKLMLSFFF
jgi:calcium homeostasis endoplasmic reticulum protein